MNIEIENPIELFAELMYLKGVLLGIEKNMPSLDNLTKISTRLKDYFEDLKTEGPACEE